MSSACDCWNARRATSASPNWGRKSSSTPHACAELSEAVDCIVSNRLSDVSGTLRLSAPPSISDSLLTPLVTAFQASYPNVRVQILVTDRFVDLIAEGVDLVFRLGALKDSSLVARPILAYRHQLVASPAYLKGCEPPQKPQDLLDHRLLSFSHWKPEDRWTFVHKNGRDKEILTFHPYLAMNDFAGLAPALLAGAGVGELLRWCSPILSARDGSSRSCRTGAFEPSISRSFISETATFQSHADCSRKSRRKWRRRSFRAFQPESAVAGGREERSKDAEA